MAGKEGGKNKKYGKNRKDPAMARYNATNRRIKNKQVKMKRHCERHRDDEQAYKLLSTGYKVDWHFEKPDYTPKKAA